MFGLQGKMYSQPGQRDALIGHLLEAANALREVEGCLLYIISSIPDEPDAIWINEVWRSAEDHQASLTLDAIKTLIASARPLIASMGEGIKVTPVGGKGL